MTIEGKPRGRYAKTAGRRTEILEAAIDVFSSGGYRSGSIREIAERVGMSQAGLLHHFSSKAELLAAVLEFRDDRDRARSDYRDVPGITTLRSLVNLIDHNASVPGLVELHCVLSAEATSAEHPAHAYFQGRYRWVVGLATDAFEDMAARGELVEGVDPAGSAKALIALMDGLQVQWLLDRSSVDMATETRRYVQRLLTVPL